MTLNYRMLTLIVAGAFVAAFGLADVLRHQPQHFTKITAHHPGPDVEGARAPQFEQRPCTAPKTRFSERALFRALAPGTQKESGGSPAQGKPGISVRIRDLLGQAAGRPESLFDPGSLRLAAQGQEHGFGRVCAQHLQRRAGAQG